MDKLDKVREIGLGSLDVNLTRVPVEGWTIWLSHLFASSTVGQADLVLCGF
jgi:hypothetical protein